jgi:hypothetical protein
MAECLVGMLSPDAVRRVSFSTSLVPSSTRLSVLTLEGGGCGQVSPETRYLGNP